MRTGALLVILASSCSFEISSDGVGRDAGGGDNNGDAFESNAEQCAYSSTSSTWQDEPCTAAHSRFTCRR